MVYHHHHVLALPGHALQPTVLTGPPTPQYYRIPWLEKPMIISFGFPPALTGPVDLPALAVKLVTGLVYSGLASAPESVDAFPRLPAPDPDKRRIYETYLGVLPAVP